MTLLHTSKRAWLPLMMLGAGLLTPAIAQAQAVLAQTVQAQYDAEQDFPEVSITDLMVNLPEPELDALALDYLQRSLQQSAGTVVEPSVVNRAQPAVQAVPVKKRDTSPSKLNFNEVVLNRTDWLSELNQQADAALASNNWPLAELKLAQALGEYPDAHETRLRLAALFYGRGALGQTRAVLQQGIELAPLQADFRLTLARLLAGQQRFVAALHQLNQVSPSFAEHLDYYSLKAETARRSGQCAQAISTYQQLLTQQSSGSWWLGLGLCQRQLGEDYSRAFMQARASADLGDASQQFVEQQLEQLALQQREQSTPLSKQGG